MRRTTTGSSSSASAALLLASPASSAAAKPPRSLTAKEMRSWARWLWLVSEATAWVCAGVFVLYHTNLWTVVTNPDHYGLNTPLLLLSAASGAVTATIFMYFQFYVTPILKRGDEDFLQTFPRQIQAATANGVICFFRFAIFCRHGIGFSFIIAVWPVWGTLSPLITGLLCISLFFLASLLSLLTPAACR